MNRLPTHALHISAIEYATARVKTQVASQPQIMTGGPPVSTPIMSTPLSAVHDVTMLKEKPTMPMRPKLRFSSNSLLALVTNRHSLTYLGYSPAVQVQHHLRRRLPPSSPGLRTGLQTLRAIDWQQTSKKALRYLYRCSVRASPAEVYIFSAAIYFAAVTESVMHG